MSLFRNGNLIFHGHCTDFTYFTEFSVIFLESYPKTLSMWNGYIFRALTGRFSAKKVFLEILQNSQGNNCAGDPFLIKVAGLRLATLLIKRLWHRCFPVNFAIFLRTPFLTEHLPWLLLYLHEPSTFKVRW